MSHDWLSPPASMAAIRALQRRVIAPSATTATTAAAAGSQVLGGTAAKRSRTGLGMRMKSPTLLGRLDAYQMGHQHA